MALILLTLVILVQRPSGLTQLGKVPALFRAPMAVVAREERWRVREVARPKEEEPVEQTARRLGLRPVEGWEHIDRVEKGSDGSLLIRRAHREIIWDAEDRILFRGREEPVPYGLVDIYKDRLNYAGSRIREKGGGGMPQSAPEGYVVVGGRKRDLGFGEVRHWGKDGTFVLEVPIDDNGSPSGTEFTTGVASRVLTSTGAVVFRGMALVRVLSDGTILLASGMPRSQMGYVPLSAESPTSIRILAYRAGNVVGHWTLPPRWRVVDASSSGWLLVRKSSPLPQIQMEGKTPDEAMRLFEKAGEAEINATELNWTAGIFSNGTIRPVSFKRPSGTSRLLWRDSETVVGRDAFRFSAFYGDTVRAFRVSKQ